MNPSIINKLDSKIEVEVLSGLKVVEKAGRYNEWLFKQCEPFLGRRVLETGSGTGRITKFLQGKEVVVATEFSEMNLIELKDTLSGRPHFFVEQFDLCDERKARELRDSHEVDSVLSINVLEHVEDDVRAMKNMNRLLCPTGRAVIVVPAHQFLFSGMDTRIGHYRRYNKSLLKSNLEKAGFRVLRIRYLNMIGATGWFVNGRILKKRRVYPGQLKVFDLLSKVLSLEAYINPPFGLSVFAVAEKVFDLN